MALRAPRASTLALLGIAALVVGAFVGAARADEASPASGAAATTHEEALERIAALALRGGCAAVEEIDALLERHGDAVAPAAFQAIRTIGLRHGRLAARVRKALDASEPGLRRTATGALGLLGSGEDVPLLIDRLEDADGPTRSAARGALEHLTGTTQATPQRWQAWWGRAQVAGRTALTGALDAIEEGGPACASVRRVRRDQVHRYAWIDLPLVERTLSDWLRNGEVPLRGEALRLMTSLRLADLEGCFRRAQPFLGKENEALAAEVVAMLSPHPAEPAPTAKPPTPKPPAPVAPDEDDSTDETH